MLGVQAVWSSGFPLRSYSLFKSLVIEARSPLSTVTSQADWVLQHATQPQRDQGTAHDADLFQQKQKHRVNLSKSIIAKRPWTLGIWQVPTDKYQNGKQPTPVYILQNLFSQVRRVEAIKPVPKVRVLSYEEGTLILSGGSLGKSLTRVDKAALSMY